jgi:predicted dehydrogenase
VGVVGVGRMGERHCRVYSSLPDVELVGVCDASPERGRQIAIRYGTTYVQDVGTLMDSVDAVSVVTPTPLHLGVATEAISRGVGVLVEKPLANTVGDARELVRLAEEAGVVLQVGHVERFNPAFLELQSIVEDLDIVAFSARRLSPFDTSNVDVDVVFDLMIHDLDLAVATLGSDLRSVSAVGRLARSEATDFAVVTLATRSGRLATLTASRVTEQKVRMLEITAIGAYVEADLLNKSVCIYRRTLPEYLSNHRRPLRYRQENLVERIYIPTAEPLALELQDFVRCVRTGETPKVSGADGLRAVEMAARAKDEMRSSALGIPLQVAS